MWRRVMMRRRWQRAYERSLNERARVEQELLDVANGKARLPDREQCRKWAVRLGVPQEWREAQG